MNVRNFITFSFAVGSSLTELSRFLWQSLLLEKSQTYSLEETGYCSLYLSELLVVRVTQLPFVVVLVSVNLVKSLGTNRFDCGHNKCS
jgi:hypothetical protein